MAGLCKPYAAHALVKALRNEVEVPIHFHTHDTSGISGASVIKEADADIVDAAMASMSGMTSQWPLNSLVAAFRGTPKDTGLDQDAVDRIDQYWSKVREMYYPFDAGLRAPAPDVYCHEMSGGRQYINLQQRATSMGLGDRWLEICKAYASANELFGDIVKVTPSSKVVGDMAMFMVSNGLTKNDIVNPKGPLQFPASVIEMMRGMLGHPPGGWPTKVRQIVLRFAGVRPIRGRPGARLKPVDFSETSEVLNGKIRRQGTDEEVLSYLLYPAVFVDFTDHVRRYGDTSVIPTPNFFYGLHPREEIMVEIERGKTLVICYLTSGQPREDGPRTVFFELSGQPREIRVVDRSVEAIEPVHPKADSRDPDHIGAPMPGKVGVGAVMNGQEVSAGEPLLWIEAMKMETAVCGPRDATVKNVLIDSGSNVTAQDLLVVLAAEKEG